MKRALIACAFALAACGPEQGRAPARETGGVSAALTPVSLAAFFDCLRENEQTIVSAHRGGPEPGFAENAIATFEHTLAQAPALLEIDVSRTRDGVLVLMHDDEVDRTTNGVGAVRDLTLAQVQALQLEDEDGEALDAHPPTLREALDWADGRAVLELDVKRGVSYEEVAREVRQAGAMDRVIFITYSLDGAARLARAAPEAFVYTNIASAGDLDALQRRGVDLTRIAAWLGDDQFDEDLVEALAARGVESRFGMFRSGSDFAGAAHAGIESLAVNDVAEAFLQIDRVDGAEGYAALQCVSAP